MRKADEQEVSSVPAFAATSHPLPSLLPPPPAAASTNMKPFICILALALTLAAGQRQGASPQYGAPAKAPAPAAPRPPPPPPAARPPPPPPQPALPSYGTETQQASQSQGQHGHDHQGLDWLLESVPGTPGTDYPIYSQENLGSFSFDCNGQVEGGYYADPASQCQAFHVCIPDAQSGLSTQSFLCPNGTIFNQEYFICDWWFNFDCSQATGLYSKNDEVAREREQASLSQASSNQQNTYAKPAAGGNRNPAPAQPSYNNNNNNNNNNQQEYQGAQQAPASYAG